MRRIYGQGAIDMVKQQDEGGDELTTIKAKKRIQRKIGKVAKLLGIAVQDVMDRYEPHIDDDLLRIMANQKAELERPRRG